MGNNNINLQSAKNTKDDEFYTTYETIEKELSHYIKHFKGKTVLCNCDDPFESNFCKYFLINFERLGLRRLICTSYSQSKMLATQSSFTDADGIPLTSGNGYVLDITSFSTTGIEDCNSFIIDFLKHSKSIKRLNGDGDFRSLECIEYLKQSDIVVTNPPFSLFKELVSLIMRYKKSSL